MAKFVDSSWTRLESLKLSLTWFVRFVVEHQFLWHGTWFRGCLAVDEVNREAFCVLDAGDVAAAGSVGHFFNVVADDLYARESGHSGRL